MIAYKLTRTRPGTITIHCEDIDLVGDIVQALAASLNIENMTSTANFPDFIEKLKEVNYIKLGGGGGGGGVTSVYNIILNCSSV